MLTGSATCCTQMAHDRPVASQHARLHLGSRQCAHTGDGRGIRAQRGAHSHPQVGLRGRRQRVACARLARACRGAPRASAPQAARPDLVWTRGTEERAYRRAQQGLLQGRHKERMRRSVARGDGCRRGKQHSLTLSCGRFMSPTLPYSNLHSRGEARTRVLDGVEDERRAQREPGAKLVVQAQVAAVQVRQAARRRRALQRHVARGPAGARLMAVEEAHGRAAGARTFCSQLVRAASPLTTTQCGARANSPKRQRLPFTSLGMQLHP